MVMLAPFASLLEQIQRLENRAFSRTVLAEDQRDRSKLDPNAFAEGLEVFQLVCIEQLNALTFSIISLETFEIVQGIGSAVRRSFSGVWRGIADRCRRSAGLRRSGCTVKRMNRGLVFR